MQSLTETKKLLGKYATDTESGWIHSNKDVSLKILVCKSCNMWLSRSTSLLLEYFCSRIWFDELANASQPLSEKNGHWCETSIYVLKVKVRLFLITVGND